MLKSSLPKLSAKVKAEGFTSALRMRSLRAYRALHGYGRAEPGGHAAESLGILLLHPQLTKRQTHEQTSPHPPKNLQHDRPPATRPGAVLGVPPACRCGGCHAGAHPALVRRRQQSSGQPGHQPCGMQSAAACQICKLTRFKTLACRP